MTGGYLDVGPWMSTAPVRRRPRLSPRRRSCPPIAEAVAGSIGVQPRMPLDRTLQQWWTDEHAATFVLRSAPLFRRFEDVHDAGQFTWAGRWTVTEPPTTPTPT